MSTKANLLTSINTQLTAIITQAKVRLASALIVDELFSNVTEETETTATVFLPLTSGIEYYIKHSKKGNVVHLNGYVRNLTAGIITGTPIWDIQNTEYRQITMSNNFFTYRAVTSKQNLIIFFNPNNTVSLSGSLEVGEAAIFNFTYLTNL